MTLGFFHGRFAINSSNDSFSIGATALTVTNRASYYITGYTGEGTNQLTQEVQARVRTVNPTANVAWSSTTGKITFTFSNVNAITWTDTDLRDILGFTSGDAVSGASTYTGSNAARYQWRPQKGLGNFPNTLVASEFWNPASTSKVVRSKDGTVYGLQGNVYYEATDLEYNLLLQADVLTPSTGSINKDFRTFFIDVVHAAGPVRFYPDVSVVSSLGYVTGLIGSPQEDQIGSFELYARRHIQNYNGLFNVRIPFVKYTG